MQASEADLSDSELQNTGEAGENSQERQTSKSSSSKDSQERGARRIYNNLATRGEWSRSLKLQIQSAQMSCR